jgi:flagellin
MNAEVTALKSEITRISSNTEWNGMKLFAATNSSAGGVGAAGNVTLQVGVDGSANNQITVQLDSITSSALTLTSLTLATRSGSTSALATLDTAIATIDTDRARFGATINRLTYAADNLANISQNTQASRSRILDTDYAQTTTELARTQIIQQAATAMLAQANQAPQSVLSLLR